MERYGSGITFYNSRHKRKAVGIVNVYRKGTERAYMNTYMKRSSPLGNVADKTLIVMTPDSPILHEDSELFMRFRSDSYVLVATVDIPIGNEIGYVWCLFEPVRDVDDDYLPFDSDDRG